jgi:TetR/AcrR family transcriptional regulator
MSGVDDPGPGARQAALDVKLAAKQATRDAKEAAKDAARQAGREAGAAARQAGREAGAAARQAAREAGSAARRAARDATAAARRAADPADRVRDSERSRRLILDAALAEFGDKGYAGARVREIARRAGVNAQLISYYFGGKAGLFDELIRHWHDQEAEIEERNMPLPDLADAYMRALLEQPDLTRIFIREGLSSDPAAAGRPTMPGEGPVPPEVADLQRRQAAGEIADDLDPAFVLIAVMGITCAPVTMPGEIERICGLPPYSPEFAEAFSVQLRRIVAHLAGTPGALDE